MVNVGLCFCAAFVPVSAVVICTTSVLAASANFRTAAFLLSPRSQGITGRFVAAPHDRWEAWPERLGQIRDSDLFTLRRIVPRDRGMDWQ